jgi:uncharacterized damage-inducible protein DinB
MNLPFQIELSVEKVFSQLREALSGLSDDDYKQSLEVLGGSSIGQHTRHVIEFFIVLIEQYDSGAVNYDKRERDHLLETNKQAALNIISFIQTAIVLKDREMILTGIYAGNPNEISVQTTYHRELVYNLEHAVHHMAMIKIGFRHFTTLSLPPDFGVAAATTRHKQSIL